MNEGAGSSVLAGLDKALWIALATPVAYLCAFEYDCGYLNFFGVPDILVDVSLRDLLIAAAAVGSIVYLLYVNFDFVLVLLPERWAPRIKQRVIWLFWIAAAVVSLLRVFDAQRYVWLAALAFIAILLILLVALPLRKIKRGVAQEESAKLAIVDPALHKGVIPELLRRGVGPQLISIITMIWVACAAVNLVGNAKATMQTSFLIHPSEDGKVCAIVRMRDSDLLCAYFNADTRMLTGDYRFLKSEATSLSLFETGRLKSVETAKRLLPTAPAGQGAAPAVSTAPTHPERGAEAPGAAQIPARLPEGKVHP